MKGYLLLQIRLLVPPNFLIQLLDTLQRDVVLWHKVMETVVSILLYHMIKGDVSFGKIRGQLNPPNYDMIQTTPDYEYSRSTMLLYYSRRETVILHVNHKGQLYQPTLSSRIDKP